MTGRAWSVRRAAVAVLLAPLAVSGCTGGAEEPPVAGGEPLDDDTAGTCPDGGTRWLEDFVLVATPTTVGGDGVTTVLDATWESTLTPTQEAIDSGCDDGQEVEQFLVGTGERVG